MARKTKDMSWDDYSSYIDIIAKQIIYNKHKSMYKNIYGIPRGGLITAVMLSHNLNIYMIQDPKHVSEETLICDDIADSGKTLKEFMKVFGRGNDIAVVIDNPTSDIRPTYCGFYNINCEWFNFPYEKEKDTVSSIKNQTEIVDDVV